MRIKVDEDLPRAAVQMLRDRGYDADSVVEQRLGGSKDPPLWQAVQAEQRRCSPSAFLRRVTTGLAGCLRARAELPSLSGRVGRA